MRRTCGGEYSSIVSSTIFVVCLTTVLVIVAILFGPVWAQRLKKMSNPALLSRRVVLSCALSGNLCRLLSGGGSSGLTHVNERGGAEMVDVAEKPESVRTATASGRVLLGKQVYDLVKTNSMKKGDVLTVAQLAGIGAAKLTSQLIPLCHPVALTKVDVKLTLLEGTHEVLVESYAKCTGKTGVEMEALSAATVAALTVYDMCKAVSRDLKITDVQLTSKTGGTRGDFHHA